MIGGMKTAISVEDSLMDEADKAARDLGLSRSALISQALRQYLAERRSAEVTEQLNRVYANGNSEDEMRLVSRFKTAFTIPDKW